jgi:hypothetical protein
MNAQLQITPASKQCGDLTDTAYVLGAIFRRKPEVGCQAVANVVAIEHENLEAAREQHFLQRECACGLSRARQSGEPQHRAFVPIAQLTIFSRDTVLDARCSSTCAATSACGVRKF